jgi:hypothetical protein
MTAQRIALLRGSSPGVGLVALGVMINYFVVGLRSDAEPTLVSYLEVGFGFLGTLAGIALLIRELGRPVTAEAEQDLTVVTP